MELILIVSINLILFIIGYITMPIFNVKNKIEMLGLSYLIGSGLITLLFLTNDILFNFNLDSNNFLFSIFTSTLLLTLILFINYRKRISNLTNFNQLLINIKQASCIQHILLIIIALIVSYTFLENYIWPITDWDALALYDFRAKVILTTGNMLEGIKLGYFFQYPPYTTFLHLFGYIFDVFRIKIAYSFIYLSLLLTFYSLLRRNQTKTIALIGTVLLGLNQFIFSHATMAYTNLPYTTFISLGFIYLLFWLHQKQKKDLILGMILIALSTWVRSSDPFWYISILIIIVGVFKNKKDMFLSISLIIFTFFIYKYWDIYVNSLQIDSNIVKISREANYLQKILTNKGVLVNQLKVIPEIISYFYKNAIKQFNYLIPLLVFTVFYDIRKKNKLNYYIYILVIIIYLLILLGIFIFSLYFETWNIIADSLQRLSMIIIPIIIYSIFNSSIWKEKFLEYDK